MSLSSLFQLELGLLAGSMYPLLMCRGEIQEISFLKLQDGVQRVRRWSAAEFCHLIVVG